MLITATGWTFDYVDELCLRRAGELLEFLNARAEAGHSGPPRRLAFSERAAEEQFFELARQGLGPVSKLPAELRQAVEWAEKVKGRS